MEPLTPNTSAFLSYLSSLDTAPSASETAVKTEPTSLPPSAFFSASGQQDRQSADQSPTSAGQTSSSSPENDLVAVNTMQAEGSDRRGSSAQHDSAGMHKRKAGQNHTVVQSSDGEEDTDDEGQSGHEDKRAHGSHDHDPAPGSGRRGRKSLGGEDGPGKGSKDSKAARRKEQNRAAQKAFRERREAKVKTLEDKVAELEQKSQGISVENENLRGLLKRLQEENVALKQSAFTFSMPVAASSSAGPGTGASTPRNLSGQYGGRSSVKPPTPPHSSSDDALKSIDDIQPPHMQHRGSSGMSAQIDTPESLNSIDSRSNSVSRSGSEQPKQPPMFDPAETFNAFALGVRPEWERQNQLNRQAAAGTAAQGPAPGVSPVGANPTNFADAMSLLSGSGSGLSPLSSSGSNNKSEIEALWASFYPNGVQPAQGQQGSAGAQGAQTSQATASEALDFAKSAEGMNPFNLFLAGGAAPATSTGFTPFINPVNNTNPMDRMAFRDSSASTVAEPANNLPLGAAASSSSPPAFDWSAYNADGIDSFLASLSGADTGGDANDGMGDDEFSTQIQALINANTSNPTSGAFGLGTMFSPSNYLNMSPSPLASDSASSGLSPASNNLSASASASNYASPDSIASSSASTAATSHHEAGSGTEPMDPANAGTTGAVSGAQASKIVYVVGPDGKVIKPSELWIKMGMQHQSTVDHLVIDDLCDQMKAKATCKDGASFLSYDDAEKMFKYNTKYASPATKAAP